VDRARRGFDRVIASNLTKAGRESLAVLFPDT